ncbi:MULTISPECIES: hypothetical protein [unclassified Marinovum]
MLIEQARKALLARANALESLEFATVLRTTFSYEEIKNSDPKDRLRGWLVVDGTKVNRAIYRLSVDTQAEASSLRAAFDLFDRKKVKLTRDNKVTDSTVVYVGSSRSIASLLRQHLFHGADQTYALKLEKWCPTDVHALNIEVLPLSDDEDFALVQDIEDALWKSSRPIFGKLGPR